ncbi:pyrroloquinoline quinone biosynthesis peptide chaperone PqqD [Sulfitobacter sp. S190]|uniref:pyrroloquinoline quinone biosynthesis peptide chaperone PqqD n=1 Tax=Sulfitobacter sp. S190 TaxID=2867022 RepID=UPI0021A3326F|nr:pyrroloquinoline quinone biosynthesis peptide chaperone PqqD [Sulfitobacter sp. S190]UWR21887.1 pyrroloquinoline quinone biosynthesis peptide chaperone PqqD [Sulfitobacter sp. S190]
MAIDAEAVPVIPRGVRLHHDTVRGIWVLLAPERTITLDPIGHAILTQIDGTSSLRKIVSQLAAQYDATPEQISGDVGDFVRGLADRRILDLTL